MKKDLPDDFDPLAYLAINPDVAIAGIDAAKHYLLFGHSERRAYKLDDKHPVPATNIDILENHLGLMSDDIDLVGQSELFDESFYRTTSKITGSKTDLVRHYLGIGERSGLSPSRFFDAPGYRYLNDDVGNSQQNALLHYIKFGVFEGRARSINDYISFMDLEESDTPFIVVMFHECSRTGAPILGWNIVEQLKLKYRVISLIKLKGPILENIKTSSDITIPVPDKFVLFPKQCDLLAGRLSNLYNPLYAISNSVETRCFVPSFAEAGIPTLSLVHEFADYDWIPEGSLSALFQKSSHVVFSTGLVAVNCLNHYPQLSNSSYEIVPQGRSVIPPTIPTTRTSENHTNSTIATLRNDHKFVVAGLGRITPRKGVDLFIETAIHLYELRPNADVVFVWVGGWDASDDAYAASQKSLIAERQLKDKIFFLPELSNLDSIYKMIDLLYLSSRLDPMPNVAIDAVCLGVPIVCFKSASGIAEILIKSRDLCKYVIENFNTVDAAQSILRISELEDRAIISREINSFSANFNMAKYVDYLDTKMLELRSLTRQDNAK